MARIEWDLPGQRLFEAGVDRGVLYPTRSWGYAWNGLTGISISPSGGSSTPFYIDGIKFDDYQTSEEFSGTINALTYPDRFERILGYSKPHPGLLIDGQPRPSFNFSYRSMLGNDTSYTSLGYKIHLVYGARIQTTTLDRQTIGNPIHLTTMSWPFTTKPMMINGHRASSHIVLDSTEIDEFLLKTIEDRLYGKEGKPPHLPSPDELLELYATYHPTGYGHGRYGHTTYGHGSEY